MNKITAKLIAICVTLMVAPAVFSHDGHGLQGTHWHATDSLGFVAVAVMLAVAVWLSRK
jgi:hypothetical protein